MCGIAGLACNQVERLLDPSALRKMTDMMRHRGPDSDGFWVSPGIGLGMCRLSIIDTVGGDQPIFNEDATVALICNGEIYNYLELREALLLRGHRFKTHSDAEVIVHLYEDHGEEFLHHLRGMFGLALWDKSRQRLLLARDRLGIKPLHYSLSPQGLVFGSELKAVLASGWVEASPDHASLRELFRYGFVRAPRTMLSQVKRLLPGQVLRFERGEIRIRSYWDVKFPHRDHYDPGPSASEWAEELRARLRESVQLHLRSDVPVGAWLSGGIDSSSIVALMQQELGKPSPSFSLGFDSPVVDELSGSRLLDEYPQYQLKGHRRVCSGHHVELIPRGVWHREQPTSLGVEISQMLISEMTAGHVKVILSGEGSDEILGGYPWYRANKILAPLGYLPARLRQALGQLLLAHGKWPGAGRILMAPLSMNRARYSALIGRPGWSDVLPLFAQGVRESLASVPEEFEEFQVPEEFPQWHPFAQLHYLDLKVRMAESVVRGLDLISMAYSLEARVPFLDHLLVEFCATIPPWVKMPGFREKQVLREAMRGILPPEIRQRKKFALSAPTEDWMRGQWPESLEDCISPQRLRKYGYFCPQAVARLRHQHRAGVANRGRWLMLILGTQIWHQQFLESFPFQSSG